MRYEFDGRTHWIDPDEVKSIVQSGIPHRIQDYAMGAHGEVYPGTGGLGALVDGIQRRTGATEAGMYPTESPTRVSVNVVLASSSNIMHLSGYACSDARKGRLEADNAAFAFMSERNPDKMCSRCAAKFGQIRSHI